jgi:hypothetical protein
VALAEACAILPGVNRTAVVADVVEVEASGGRRLIPAVVSESARVGVVLSSAEVVEPNLEHVFLALTGKELRD